jgi:FtsP/CotA-like multicopper oxidase with cupredoxin domain
VNASPSRYYALRLDGLPLHLIATDGGRLDAPQPVDEIVLVPGERAEVLIPVSAAGSHVLTTRGVDRGGMGMGGMQGGMGRGDAAGQADGATIVPSLVVEGAGAPAPALPSWLRATKENPPAK